MRELAETKALKVTRFLRDVQRIEVDFDEERNPRVADRERCEILVHVTGNLLKGTGAAPEVHAALDRALERVERQARRLHGRRVGRSHPRRSRDERRVDVPSELEPAPGSESDAVVTVDEPSIVKTKQFPVKPMSPTEAALQMELLQHDFFLFTNSENGRAAVLYRRRDGDLGLIEAG